MNSSKSIPVIALVIVLSLFLVFGGGALTGRMADGAMQDHGWLSDRGWMWTPTILMLVIGFALGWVIFRKKR